MVRDAWTSGFVITTAALISVGLVAYWWMRNKQ